MKQKLSDLNQMIAFFSKLCMEFPKAECYQASLLKLEKERAELVATIGHKRFAMRVRQKMISEK